MASTDKGQMTEGYTLADVPPGLQRYARSLSLSVGPTRCSDVARHMRLADDPGLVELSLSHDWFDWLDPAHEWYWAVVAPDDDRSSTFQACRKALVVAGALPADRLLLAVQRKANRAEDDLPLEVFERYLRQHAGFRKVGGEFALVEVEPPLEKVFQGAELAVVQALMSLGGQSSPAVISQQAVAHGASETRAQEMLRQSPAIQRISHGLYGFVSDEISSESSNSCVQAEACAAGTYWGPVSLELLRKRLGSEPMPEQLRSEVDAVAGLDWLDEDKDWYWYAADPSLMRQSMAFMCAKVLIVAGTLSLEELQEAIARDRGRPIAQVPLTVLRSYLALHPAFDLGEDGAALQSPFPGKLKYVGEIERKVIRLMRELGPICRRQDIVVGAELKGIKLQKVETMLNSSPLITRQHRGLYSVVGTHVSASQLWDMVNGADE
jgi:hypothetical protein